jgi:hypothetical protein
LRLDSNWSPGISNTIPSYEERQTGNKKRNPEMNGKQLTEVSTST